MRQRVPAAQPPHELVCRQPIDVADVVAELRQRPRLGCEPRDTGTEGGHPPCRRRLESVLAALVLEDRHDRGPQRPIVRRRHEVQRRAHQRALDEPPTRDGAVQVPGLERREPRPQADVGRRGLLRLEPTDPLDGVDHAEIRRLEQQLTSERGPTEPARAEDLDRGGRRHSGGSCPERNVAMSSV